MRALVPCVLLVLAPSCKGAADELPSHLNPAPGETVRYSPLSNRCPVMLERYEGADGQPAGNVCVSHALLAQICRRAARCDEVEHRRKEPLIDRSVLMKGRDR